ncbi:LacI family DNA-binding transcriptional regulator [Glycomyces luteolus]|uniref:LacI family DNA-binding transcriptional regulator n=1 Tax=Glycomyces luteolus TaxID=2670330 RepID=A0A9X3PBR6_9ACTN|nr:LacI family DNA-binding transcriptional regulator [Glycomyces luteolus]MDA1362478.1 LacI family DNA-binding transcriptional regulator [Glycomyces luteolus]
MTSQARPKAKLASIAREVGVSSATVSKVLNGHADVAADTRARVRSALERHAYPIPAFPMKGVRQHGALVDVVIHELDSAWAGTLLGEIERAAVRHERNLVVSTVETVRNRHVPPRRWLNQIAARGTCGVLGVLADFTGTQLDYMRDEGIPCIVIDPRSEPGPGMAAVRLNHRDAQYRLTEHLLSLGHTRIAMVSGNPYSLPSRERQAGFESAMADAGLPVPAEWTCEGGFNQRQARAALAALMALPEPPTAVAFASDKAALAALAEARRLGIKVPEDLSITGFDDIPDAENAMIPLTTVRQPVAAAVDTAMRYLVGPPNPGVRFVCESEVIPRESTAPPNPGR